MVSVGTPIPLFTKAEIDAMSRVSDTNSPHVIVIGVQAPTGEWVYTMTDPMPYLQAEHSAQYLHNHNEAVGRTTAVFTRQAP